MVEEPVLEMLCLEFGVDVYTVEAMEFREASIIVLGGSELSVDLIEAVSSTSDEELCLSLRSSSSDESEESIMT